MRISKILQDPDFFAVFFGGDQRKHIVWRGTGTSEECASNTSYHFLNTIYSTSYTIWTCVVGTLVGTRVGTRVGPRVGTRVATVVFF